MVRPKRLERLSTRRLVALLLGNLVVFAVLFAALELGVRMWRDGIGGAFSRIFDGEPTPYSTVGTGKWVVSDPELGYRLNTENPLSIRGPMVAVPKPSGLFRIVVLGDSIPFDRSGFVASLTERLGHPGAVEVINASVPGYTSYQELLFLKRYLLQTEPDLVIWVYCLNDNHKFLHRFDEEAHMLLTPEAEESLAIRSRWDWIVSRSYVLSSFRIALLARQQHKAAARAEFPWEGRPDFNIAWKDYSWSFYEGHLKEMREQLQRHGSRLAVVVVPFEPQLQLRTMRDRLDYILSPQRHLSELCRKHGVACLDLFPPFEHAYDNGSKLFRDGIHLNQEGHRLAEAEIFRFLNQQHLLPGDSNSTTSDMPASGQGRREKF